MPMIMKRVSIPATGGNDNILAGSAFEITRQRSVCSLGLIQQTGGMFASFSAGSDIVVESHEPPIGTTYPKIPDEMYFTDVVEVLDRLTLPVRNPTGGALLIWAAVQLSPIAGR